MSRKLHEQDYQIVLKQGLAANIDVDATKLQAIRGEPAYTTDTKKLYVFDGTHFLPVPAFASSVNDAGPMTATNGTAGDIVFNISDGGFYGCTVTGTPATWVKLG